MKLWQKLSYCKNSPRRQDIPVYVNGRMYNNRTPCWIDFCELHC
jgi:hypothetical protein